MPNVEHYSLRQNFEIENGELYMVIPDEETLTISTTVFAKYQHSAEDGEKWKKTISHPACA